MELELFIQSNVDNEQTTITAVIELWYNDYVEVYAYLMQDSGSARYGWHNINNRFMVWI
jgi:hypothetical protein